MAWTKKDQVCRINIACADQNVIPQWIFGCWKHATTVRNHIYTCRYWQGQKVSLHTHHQSVIIRVKIIISYKTQYHNGKVIIRPNMYSVQIGESTHIDKVKSGQVLYPYTESSHTHSSIKLHALTKQWAVHSLPHDISDMQPLGNQSNSLTIRPQLMIHYMWPHQSGTFFGTSWTKL